MTPVHLVPFEAHDIAAGPTLHERIGFEIGWDHAHHRLEPGAPYADEPSPLRDGLLSGRAAFGARTLAPTRHVRQWLRLRLHAWLRGRIVETVQVTPNHLRQIDTGHCPITRVSLTGANACVDRVRDDAAYAAGNLVVMSTKANRAKAAHGRTQAAHCAEQLRAGGASASSAGLDAAQWARIAVLCSFVEPLPHDQACAIPLLVLPPNRLRLFNPVQALQAFVSRQLLAPGWSGRLSRLEAMLPDEMSRRDFRRFMLALLPRTIESGRSSDPMRRRWAVEDAWRCRSVQQCWEAFARRLDAARCESLLVAAAQRRLEAATLLRLTDAAAVDGWGLDTRGYVPYAVASTGGGRPPLQAQLAW